jgi:hypothetical protein
MSDAGFNHMLHQLPRQQSATCHSLDYNPSSRGHAAATLHNSYASAASHTMVVSPAFIPLAIHRKFSGILLQEPFLQP